MNVSRIGKTFAAITFIESIESAITWKRTTTQTVYHVVNVTAQIVQQIDIDIEIFVDVVRPSHWHSFALFFVSQTYDFGRCQLLRNRFHRQLLHVLRFDSICLEYKSVSLQNDARQSMNLQQFTWDSNLSLPVNGDSSYQSINGYAFGNPHLRQRNRESRARTHSLFANSKRKLTQMACLFIRNCDKWPVEKWQLHNISFLNSKELLLSCNDPLETKKKTHANWIPTEFRCALSFPPMIKWKRET